MQRNHFFSLLFFVSILAFIVWLMTGRLSKENNELPETTQGAVEKTITSNDIKISPAQILAVTQIGTKFNVNGTGVAGANLSLNLGEGASNIAITTINEQGGWDVGFVLENPAYQVVLNLIMVLPNGQEIQSDQNLILVQGTDATDEEQINKALILLAAPGSNSRILQTPFEHLPGKEGFVLEAIDYDNSGGVIFSGISVQTGKVRVYANGNLVGESGVNQSGRWNLIFGNIMPMGEYNIAVELMYKSKEAGKNTDKTILLTLPFSRMQPLFEAENSPKIFVEFLGDRIQIGRSLYGGGYQFTVIYSPDALMDTEI